MPMLFSPTIGEMREALGFLVSEGARRLTTIWILSAKPSGTFSDIKQCSFLLLLRPSRLWVISGHDALKSPFPLCTRKRTSFGAVSISTMGKFMLVVGRNARSTARSPQRLGDSKFGPLHVTGQRSGRPTPYKLFSAYLLFRCR